MMTTTGIKCGKCKGYHPTIADVRSCSTGSAAESPQQPLPGFVNNPATVKQVNFIRSLADRKDWAADDGTQQGSDASDTIMNVLDGKQISFDEARSTLDWMTKLPDGAASRLSVDIQAGMYTADDGTIYRAYLGQQSGQILAKRIVKRGVDEDGNDKYGFEYAGLAARFVKPEQRMSLDDAKKWGKATNTCCVCARRLDVPESVDAGIGPVCAGKDW